MVCVFLSLAGQPQFAAAFLSRLRGFHSSRAGHVAQSQAMAALPKLFFWAWERPEDLRFLESKNVGVAFLAKTIYVPAANENARKDSSASLIVRPRLQPLRVAPSTPVVAVVRIETLAGRQPAFFVAGDSHSPFPSAFTPQRIRRLVDEILDVQKLPNIRAIQIDFDATVSERATYAKLLKDLRQNLSPPLPLSITALASWCIGDPWLEQLPSGTIDEAVPMLFRMGPDTVNVTTFLRSGDNFRAAACQNSLGLSIDEPLSNGLLKRTLPNMSSDWHAKRIYVFASRAWTKPAAEAVLKEWQP
jgi:hypothetical protein